MPKSKANISINNKKKTKKGPLKFMNNHRKNQNNIHREIQKKNKINHLKPMINRKLLNYSNWSINKFTEIRSFNLNIS